LTRARAWEKITVVGYVVKRRGRTAWRL